MPIRHATGSVPFTAIKRGSTPIISVRRGSVPLWTTATIRDDFSQYSGTGNWLQDWINELVSDLGALVSNGIGTLVDGLGNVVGNLVAFVQGTANQLGQLVSHAGSAVVDAYCAAWGANPPAGGGVVPPPDGLLGLINGIPFIGPYLGAALAAFLSGISTAVTAITNLVGQVPVVGNLAQMIGLIPDAVTGALADPINFVTDAIGDVVGTVTCGRYTPTGLADEAVNYVIGVINGTARMLIPDGLLSLNTQCSQMRYPTQLIGDDGYLEVGVADAGSPGMPTQIFRRYANDGTGARGVGIHLQDSAISIVRRVGGVDTLVVPAVAGFGGGDRLLLNQAGNVHTLRRNGLVVGEWDDAGSSAAAGASNRSVAMNMCGAKELLGQRRFSPALTYLEAA